MKTIIYCVHEKGKEFHMFEEKDEYTDTPSSEYRTYRCSVCGGRVVVRIEK